MWRGDLSECRTTPFGCEAVVKPVSKNMTERMQGAASQPNGDKSPRHKTWPDFNNIVFMAT
jgi:hypothetical protein